MTVSSGFRTTCPSKDCASAGVEVTEKARVKAPRIISDLRMTRSRLRKDVKATQPVAFDPVQIRQELEGFVRGASMGSVDADHSAFFEDLSTLDPAEPAQSLRLAARAQREQLHTLPGLRRVELAEQIQDVLVAGQETFELRASSFCASPSK